MFLSGRWAWKKIQKKRELRRQNDTVIGEDAQRFQPDGYTDAAELSGTSSDLRSTQLPREGEAANVADDYAQHQHVVGSDIQTQYPVTGTLSAYPASQFSLAQQEIEVRGKWIWIPEPLQAPVPHTLPSDKGLSPVLANGQGPNCELPGDNTTIHELPISQDSEHETRPSSASDSRDNPTPPYDSKPTVHNNASRLHPNSALYPQAPMSEP